MLLCYNCFCPNLPCHSFPCLMLCKEIQSKHGREQSALSHCMCWKCKLNVQVWLLTECSQTVTCMNLDCFNAVTNLQPPRAEWLSLSGRGRTQLSVSLCCKLLAPAARGWQSSPLGTPTACAACLGLSPAESWGIWAHRSAKVSTEAVPAEGMRGKWLSAHLVSKRSPGKLGFAGGEDRADLPQPLGCPELRWGNGQHRAGQPLPMSPVGICLSELPAPAGTTSTRPGLPHANPYPRVGLWSVYLIKHSAKILHSFGMTSRSRRAL